MDFYKRIYRRGNIVLVDNKEIKNSLDTPSAFIKSLGCISNLIEGSSYEELLLHAGYNLVKNVNKADLILINTCAFNQLKENEAIKFIEYAKLKKNNNARIIICGCLPKINKERLRKIHTGLVFGPKNPSELTEFLKISNYNLLNKSGIISYSQYSILKKAIYHVKKVINVITGLDKLPLVKRIFSTFFIYSKDVFCLKVVTGCSGKCSYCAIRFAKGGVVSKPKDDIINEFFEALDNGYKKFILVGDEITAYGNDFKNGINIFDIINTIIKNEKVETLYLESFEPSFMISHFDDVEKILASRKIPVFCSSVQSGSNHILELMKRNYLADDFIRCMQNIRTKFPSVYLRNEIIVGFPGENEDDFNASLELIKIINIDFVHVYEYEDRPNTLATRMPDKIPVRVKRIRRKKIIHQHWKNIFLKPH